MTAIARLRILIVDDDASDRVAIRRALDTAGVEAAVDEVSNAADALRKIEGDDSFDGQQRFLEVASRLARERRLSRFIYLAEKPA